MVDYSKYENLKFSDFKKMALDDNLSCFEKIGFPDSYREGSGPSILRDIETKLTNLKGRNKTVLDIGAGCSELPILLTNRCGDQKHKLYLVDSEEMLALLPDKTGVEKIPGYFPEIAGLFDNLTGNVDVILVYSVIQYVFVEANLWKFIDRSLSLLAEGGQILIGDIPNISKRKRFFSSEAGVQFHKKFMKTETPPIVNYDQIENCQIDDSVIQAIVQRARIQGFDAYILPQSPDLPMANRREDILIVRP